jgi:hypothetical protein
LPHDSGFCSRISCSLHFCAPRKPRIDQAASLYGTEGPLTCAFHALIAPFLSTDVRFRCAGAHFSVAPRSWRRSMPGDRGGHPPTYVGRVAMLLFACTNSRRANRLRSPSNMARWPCHFEVGRLTPATASCSTILCHWGIAFKSAACSQLTKSGTSSRRGASIEWTEIV